ncbi:kinase-like domain-containing protein [Blastocladiella britannica]|nr:kinase-like domain-containing protein [Blastocladiella britannica]
MDPPVSTHAKTVPPRSPLRPGAGPSLRIVAPIPVDALAHPLAPGMLSPPPTAMSPALQVPKWPAAAIAIARPASAIAASPVYPTPVTPTHPAAPRTAWATSSTNTVHLPASKQSWSPWVDSFIASTTNLNDYRMLKTLGQGTFGKVKLAEHIESRGLVAIKIMEKDSIKTEKQKSSVRREIRLLFLLKHPNIVNVHDVIETPDHIYIVMEHLPRGELFDHIVKNHHLSESEARRFMSQIVAAVEYCHQHSVIHRDLKPENLLLDFENNLKIIDFGFVNTFDGVNMLDTYCGSPFYASPQMIRGIKYTGPESDVWSLGVILFAMLSGRLPFDADDMRKLYQRIADGAYRCPSHFSPAAVDLIGKMLEVDPIKRYTIEQVKAHAWMRVGGNGTFQDPVAMAAAAKVAALGRNSTTTETDQATAKPAVARTQGQALDDLIDIIESFGIGREVIVRTVHTPAARHPAAAYYKLLAATMRAVPAHKGCDSVYGSAEEHLAPPATPFNTSKVMALAMSPPSPAATAFHVRNHAVPLHPHEPPKAHGNPAISSPPPRSRSCDSTAVGGVHFNNHHVHYQQPAYPAQTPRARSSDCFVDPTLLHKYTPAPPPGQGAPASSAPSPPRSSAASAAAAAAAAPPAGSGGARSPLPRSSYLRDATTVFSQWSLAEVQLVVDQILAQYNVSRGWARDRSGVRCFHEGTGSWDLHFSVLQPDAAKYSTGAIASGVCEPWVMVATSNFVVSSVSPGRDAASAAEAIKRAVATVCAQVVQVLTSSC